MAKEQDARNARRARIAAMSAEEKRALIGESDARHEEEHDAFVSDPVLPVLMDALIASLEPARGNRQGRQLLREARALRATLIGSR